MAEIPTNKKCFSKGKAALGLIETAGNFMMLLLVLILFYFLIKDNINELTFKCKSASSQPVYLLGLSVLLVVFVFSRGITIICRHNRMLQL